MLQAAYSRSGDLQVAYAFAYNDPKFQWFFGAYTDLNLVIPSSDWTAIHYASVDESGKICGHLWAEIDRDTRTIENIGAICFNPGHSVTFAKDIRRFFARLLCGGWARISWNVEIGNPAESMYDRGIAKLGGRIVGIKRKWRRDRVTGAYRDSKMYEVLPEEVSADVMSYLKSIDPLRAWGSK